MNLYHDTIGLIHLIFAILSLFSGTYILWSPKGTINHKKIGYIYIISMLVVNITAFMIYRLFGSFGIFHWFAVISIISIALGILPFIISKDSANIITHFSFMYWSVIGLYAAFVSEVFTRLPKILNPGIESNDSVFFIILNITVFLMMGFGAYFFIRNKKKWAIQFSKNK